MHALILDYSQLGREVYIIALLIHSPVSLFILLYVVRYIQEEATVFLKRNSERFHEDSFSVEPGVGYAMSSALLALCSSRGSFVGDPPDTGCSKRVCVS